MYIIFSFYYDIKMLLIGIFTINFSYPAKWLPFIAGNQCNLLAFATTAEVGPPIVSVNTTPSNQGRIAQLPFDWSYTGLNEKLHPALFNSDNEVFIALILSDNPILFKTSLYLDAKPVPPHLKFSFPQSLFCA